MSAGMAARGLGPRPDCDLAGCGVLVTRPAAQADGLCRLIEAAGGQPLRFPTIEIRAPADPAAATALLGQSWDLIVFISRNAVEQALVLGGGTGFADGAELAAVGRATAATMAAAGLGPLLVPASGFDSEALLALPALAQVAGRRVLIVRGEGGRALLGDELRERGGEVYFAEVYRRAPPDVDVTDLLPQWQQRLGCVTATSDEALENLLGLVPSAEHPWLMGLPLAVLSERNAASARQLGFGRVAVATHAGDDGMLAALCRLVGGAAAVP